MRLCPSVEGSASPLITHRIGVEVCMARQGTFFHKCHRCIYRGQAASWEPAEAPLAMLNVHAAEEPSHIDVRTIEIVRPEPARKPAKPAKPAAPVMKPAAAAAKKPAKSPKPVEASL
jgi:hypothetical protein